MIKNINEVWQQLPSKPWAYWIQFAAERRGHAQDLGLILDGVTKDKDAVELWKSTVCPSWASVELGSGSGESGGAPSEAVIKRHREIWGQGEWYQREMDGFR